MSLSDKDIKTWDQRLIDQVRLGWENYKHIRIDLATARTDLSFNVAGEFIYVEASSSTLAVAKIKLNRNTNDALDFELGTLIRTIFVEVFITNAALPGEWLDLLVGINFEYEKEQPVAVSAVAGVVHVDDNAASLTVDGTFWQATQPVSAAALPLPAGAATAALQTQPGVDVGDVTVNNLSGAAAVNVQDGGNSLTVDGTVTAGNASGDIAHDAADSGNPVKIGGKAFNMDGTAPGTAVAEADRANFITDLYGRQCVETVHPNFWSAPANYASAQTAVEIKAAPGAGLSLYITDVVCSNGATAGNMKFGEDTAALVDKIEILYFAVNGGAALHFRTPIKLTANKNFGITSVSCTTHSVTVCGYTAP